MSASRNRLLVIDDEAGVREFIRDVAEELGFAVIEVADPNEFLTACQEFAPSVIALDLVIPGTDGIELLRGLAKQACGAKVLIMSGHDAKVLAAAQHLGAAHGLQMSGVLQKPISIDVLEAALRRTWDETNPITQAELAAAIDGADLTLRYQPKVDLARDGALPIDSVEALVRWDHPARGLLSPDAFIPLAEETGLIKLLTDVVLRSVIAQLQHWHRNGLALPVAVNLSPQLLTELAFPDLLAKQLQDARVDPSNLILEITESAAMADGPNTIDILTRFRLKNIRLSLDDFGTGYSSLVELYRMPFTEIKIDRSFVLDIVRSEEARIIVRSIVDLGKNLGLSVCAEGVETQAALDYLRSIGCHKAQGYLFAKPLPASGLMEFVQTWSDPAAERCRA
jgi:EAL domain-containing protein (putative c-di-GMP-specific phosphodiesterase class I)